MPSNQVGSMYSAIMEGNDNKQNLQDRTVPNCDPCNFEEVEKGYHIKDDAPSKDVPWASASKDNKTNQCSIIYNPSPFYYFNVYINIILICSFYGQSLHEDTFGSSKIASL